MHAVRPIRPFLVAGTLAAATATLVNLVVSFLAEALGWWTGTAPSPMGAPIGVEAIVTFSVVPPLLGSIVGWWTMRLPGSAPTTFLIVAAVTFAAFAVGPFGIGAARSDVWVLQVLHLPVAVATVAFVLRAARRDRR